MINLQFVQKELERANKESEVVRRAIVELNGKKARAESDVTHAKQDADSRIHVIRDLRARQSVQTELTLELERKLRQAKEEIKAIERKLEEEERIQKAAEDRLKLAQRTFADITSELDGKKRLETEYKTKLRTLETQIKSLGNPLKQR